MVKTCLICGNKYFKGSTISFHSFPKQEARRREWATHLNVCLPPETEKNIFVCSSHFKEENFFLNKCGRKYLLDTAVPLVNLKTDLSSDEKESNGSNTPSSETLTVSEVVTPTFSESEIDSSRIETLKRKRENWNDKDSMDSLSSETLTASETDEIKTENRPKKRFLQARYFGDCRENSSPTSLKQNWEVAKQYVTKQQNKIKILQQQNRRMKAKIDCQKSLLDYLREHYQITDTAESTLKATLEGTGKELFTRFLRGPSKQEYTPALRAFALTLHFYNSKAYDFVRSELNNTLPHPHTLSKWYQKINGAPGFSEEAKNTIEMKVGEEKLRGQEVLCSLVVDSMSIRRRIEWTGQKSTGYIDFGGELDSDEVPEAKEVLLFMLVAINGRWKIPVAYFLINGLTGKEQANLLTNVLKFIHHTGIIVCSITFDGAPQNLTMVETLGANLSIDSLETWFPHPEDGHRVFIFLDPCHMLKLIRNCLATYKRFITDENEIISWHYFINLAEFQKTEGLSAATKLRQRHIEFVNEKMNVSLAAQSGLLSKISLNYQKRKY